jgi:molecular chaperone GrpE
MIKKIEVKTDTEKTSQIEKAIQDEEKPVEKGHKAKEKPLEKMTKPELLEKINELQEESEKNHDLYLRSEAEIENIKKRNKKEKEDWVKYANETLVKEILPVIDNLEMAISHAHNENSLHALREGVELTLKGLRDTLEKSGLEEVKAEGEPFDPSYHHAVSEQEDQNVEAGIILQELQKGYTLNKRLIRPAMVVVSRGKPDDATNHDKVRG